MRRNLRYLILFLILFFVAANEAAIKLRTASWDRPLDVHIYAVSGDGQPASESYVDLLAAKHFVAIEEFVNREAKRYGLPFEAIEVVYHGRLESHPPQPPSGQSVLQNMWWSLRFRFWAWRRGWSSDNDSGDVELFINYFDTATSNSLRHSVGLQGGMIGIINAFAEKSYRGSNHVVVIHELMHTLGAKDKYDSANLPVHPEGYADPFRNPRYPQSKAEIMGGRIPLSAQHSQMPERLEDVVVGAFTAAEINWQADSY